MCNYLPWIRVPTDGPLVVRATEIAEAWRISFWDGMIVAAAERCGAAILLSEDLRRAEQRRAASSLTSGVIAAV